MFTNWILGVLLRPAATFERARHELRFDYLWILLSAFTLEVVVSIYGPATPGVIATTDEVVVSTLTILVVMFDLQVILFWGAARLFGWVLPWREAIKYIGLAWSFLLIEDVLTFYPYLKNQLWLLKWVDIPFMLWYIIAVAAGVRRLSGQSRLRSFLMTALATVPWWGSLLWLNWS